LLVVAPILAAVASADDGGSSAETLVARTLAPTPVVEDLRELTDTIGGRPTGSAALDKAIDWAVARLRAAGVDRADTEGYVSPRLWLPEEERVEITKPVIPGGALRAVGLVYGSNTAAAGLEADVVDVGAGSGADLAAAGDVKGKWVLLHTKPMRTIDDLFAEYLDLPPTLTRLREGGAAGVLHMSTRPGKLLYRHNLTLDGTVCPLPGALLEREGALRIARLLAAGVKVRVKATLIADMPVKAPSRNVVAEIRGSSRPDEVVILGAHLDSWDLGRGALDNGCNVALVIDVARQMAALAKTGTRPRRTVRFVLYTGEEAGMFGSLGEVRARRGHLDDVKAQVIFDEGTGRTSGFSLGGRDDLRPAVSAALAPVAALGPFEQTVDAFVGTDNYDYLVEGVPTLVANQDGAPYLPDYHAESDTFDKADLRELKLNTGVAAAVTWGLANAEALPGRQSRGQVEALLKATGLDQQMKTFGYWDDFVSGARGRAPDEGASVPSPRP
jgi:carboxypeptidase Q